MTPLDAKVIVTDIRYVFPDPSPSAGTVKNVETPDAYCVGGAYLKRRHQRGLLRRLCAWIFRCAPPHFPTKDQLSVALLCDNTNLAPADAMTFAHDIIGANDSCRYEDAWRHLERALCYKKHERMLCLSA